MEEVYEDQRCSVCGNISELVDAIGPEEIVRVCEFCAKKNSLPIIHKATNEEIGQIQTFYKKRFELVNNDLPTTIALTTEKNKEDKELERVLRTNLIKGDYPELIDNFHWYIQQARRIKKLSQKQLSDSIAEPEVIIDLAEQGKLPDNHDQLITKIEQYLRISIRKEPLTKTGQGQHQIEIIEENPENLDLDKKDWVEKSADYFKSLKDKWFPKEDSISEEKSEKDEDKEEKPDKENKREKAWEEREKQEKIEEEAWEKEKQARREEKIKRKEEKRRAKEERKARENSEREKIGEEKEKPDAKPEEVKIIKTDEPKILSRKDELLKTYYRR
ncbi:MAG: hypothetical protein WC796_03050 [Candidatus Pacearchaeota archaeon]|jgi:ribosome-binding protein aMBF1 (putative translation factor)